jgi:hypothetical protein
MQGRRTEALEQLQELALSMCSVSPEPQPFVKFHRRPLQSMLLFVRCRIAWQIVFAISPLQATSP